jgi:geranylgeranyl diphosphate synthase, type II
MKIVTEYLEKAAALTEQEIDKVLPPETEYPRSIHALMRYSIFAGGKRLRPALIMASHTACGGRQQDERVLVVCAAFEMLHTFSLIHDDLPCMDDDDLRRGKPTAHRAFNEALAVLGGDALCILAFECLARAGSIDIIRETSVALGTDGMIGGQVVDIESEGKEVDAHTVDYIHLKKTAALITASVRVGAQLADASAETLEHLTVYGRSIGLAFQIVDDILDEEGTTEQIGKDAGSDRERGKATYPRAYGMEQSKRMALELIEEAQQRIAFLDDKGEMLRLLAEFVRTRVK